MSLMGCGSSEAMEKHPLLMELKHVSREEAQTQMNAAGGNLNQIL